jgi:hypothetical protein
VYKKFDAQNYCSSRNIRIFAPEINQSTYTAQEVERKTTKKNNLVISNKKI